MKNENERLESKYDVRKAGEDAIVQDDLIVLK